MPQVLTTNAIITCPHTGVGVSTPMHPLWSVEGGVVLVENDSGVLACPFLAYPCGGYTLHSMGLNATLVDGLPVILSTDFNQTWTGLPLTMIERHATFDDSTVAPLLPGQAAPPLSPAAADVVNPTVLAAPHILGFSNAASPVLPLLLTFDLAATYPARWILTMLDLQQQKTSQLQAAALPPGLTLSPSDGTWDSPALTVTMSMTTPFLTGLAPGHYHFYMTGVSQRGLSGHAFADLNVT